MTMHSTPVISTTPAPSDRRDATIPTLHVNPAHRDVLEHNGLTSAEAVLALRGDAVLDKPGLPSWRERIRLTLHDPNGHPRIYFLKRFRNITSAAERERRRCCPPARTQAGVEWHWLHELNRAGVPCAAPVALAEDVGPAGERASALLTAAVPGESLERLAQRSVPLPRTTIQRLLVDTAHLVARLHRAGLVHRDLYLSHLFADLSDPLRPQLCLIDLQRVIRPRWLRTLWLVKDLAALHYSTPAPLVTASDRLHWLKQYWGVPKLDRMQRRIVRRIVARARRIERHDRRRALRLQRSSMA